MTELEIIAKGHLDSSEDFVEEETSVTSSSSSTPCQSPSLNRTESTTSSQKELIADDDKGCDQGSTGEAPPLSKSSPGQEAPPTSSKKGQTSTSNGTKSNTSVGTTSSSVKSKLKNPLTLFRKKSEKNKEREERQAKFEKMLQAVKVETLPQLFVTKYIGYKPTKGLYGFKYTREAAEDLVSESQKNLPLTQLHVSVRGIHVTEHAQSNSASSKALLPDTGLVPIEFISYGVQDMRYTKLFTFILVRELSSHSRSLECHAYLCDSSATCRKLALSMSLAFREYSRNLKDKPHKFEVDLSTEHMIEHGQFLLKDTEYDA